MSFTDKRFAYGPFAPHWVPKQYIEEYFTSHRIDSLFVGNTTVEDVSRIPNENRNERERWKLTLRRFDAVRKVDIWWEEKFDAVIFANGHYSVPFVCLPSFSRMQILMIADT
jgi:cation diffusion facilitator CzcD-associated flavoprotein CzcO